MSMHQYLSTLVTSTYVHASKPVLCHMELASVCMLVAGDSYNTCMHIDAVLICFGSSAV